MKHGVLTQFLIFIAICAVVITTTFPALLHLSTKLVGDGGDAYQFVGFQYAIWQNIQSGKPPLGETTLFRYPLGIQIDKSMDGYFGLLVGALFTPLVGSIAAYNISVFLTIGANIWAAYLFYAYLTKSRILGLLGGILYGASFFVLARAGGHLNLLFVAGWPLLGLFIMRLKDKEHPEFIDFAWIAASILTIAFGSLQYMIMLPVVCIITVFWYMIVYKPKLVRLTSFWQQYSRVFMSVGIIFLVLFFGIFYSWIHLAITGSLNLGGRQFILNQYAPRLEDILLPNAYLPTIIGKYLPVTEASIERVLWIGFVEIGLLLLALFDTNRKRTVFLGGTLITLLFVAFAWQTVFFFSLFRGISEPGRLYVVWYLILCALIVLGLKRWEQYRKIFAVVVCLCIALVVGERTSLSFFQSSPLKDDYTQTVKQASGKAVLDVPVDPYKPRYDVLPIWYEKPIVNGYFHWAGDTQEVRSYIEQDLFSPLRCASDTQSIVPHALLPKATANYLGELTTVLKAHGIETIVVHKDDKYLHPVCDGVRSAMEGFTTNSAGTAKVLPYYEVQLLSFHADQDQPITSEVLFPIDGEVSIEGVLVYPALPSLQLTIQNKNLGDLSKLGTWENTANGQLFHPTSPLVVDVSSGSSLGVTDTSVRSTTAYVTIWYSYTPKDLSQEHTTSALFEKIYTSETTDIYQLN